MGRTMLMIKRTLTLCAALAVGLCLFAGPVAAQYAEPATLTSSDGSACAPGTGVTLTVEGAVPGTDVTFLFEPGPVVLGIVTADANGVAVLQATWPVNASEGNHTVTVQGQDGDPEGPQDLDLSIDVQCAAGAAAAPLARTGSDSLPWVQVGVVLVAVGGLLVLAARRRHAVVHERV